MSRVVDPVAFLLQAAGDVTQFGSGPTIDAAGYPTLVGLFDGWWPQGVPFHPFLHEVVDVVEAEQADEEPSIVHVWWPGFMVGSLLMARSGVTVRAGRRH